MRKAWRILVWLCGLLIFLAAFLIWQWQQLLTRLDISDVHWDLHDLGWRSAHFNELHFSRLQGEQRVQVALTDLQLHWQWQGFLPVVQHLVAQDLLLETHPSGIAPESSPSSPLVLPDDWQLPHQLPRTITVNRMRLNLPCATDRCELAARVQGTLAENLLTLEIRLEDTPTPVLIDVTYEVRAELPQLRWSLRAPQLLQLNNSMALVGAPATPATPAQAQWQGELQLAIQPPSAQWVEYLQRWLPLNQQSIEHFTQPLQANAAWQLEWLPLTTRAAAVTDFASAVQWVRDHLHGEIELALDAPAPFPLPGLGGVSGQAQLALVSEPGQITRHTVDVDLQIAPVILPESLAPYDLALDQLVLKLLSRSENKFDVQALPLVLQVRTQGRQRLSADAALVINSDNLDIQIVQADVQLQTMQWSPLDDLTLTDLTLETQFSGSWRAGVFVYEQQAPGVLTGSVATSEAQLNHGKLEVEQLQLQVDPQAWSAGELNVTGELSAAEIIHAELNPQAWHWQGAINASQGRAELEGKLSAANGFALDHQLQIDEHHQWQLTWQLPDIFLLAGNSLQELTPRWPVLLTLTRGRIGAQGWVAGRAGSLTSDMTWHLVDVTGIYDTTAFKGASGQMQITLADDVLAIASDKVNISELARGLTAGPVSLKGEYRMNLAAMNAQDGALNPGIIVLDQAEAVLLGGVIRILPVTVDLSKADQPLVIELANIDLGKLLEIHPSSELRGSGKMSGQIPLVWSPAGLRVAKGMVAAQAPGGHLQYQSQGATAMAAGAQGMKIVTDALSDFHYTLLTSEVTYEQDGTLLLGVRLEGSNPALENGRAINFNVTLEEDLPALMTSLQLSGQISDVIKKRVQDKLQQRNKP
jgi:hypothetical protein